ncbi:MAG: DUF4129 domain-containing protein [Chloroflexota bacterium]
MRASNTSAAATPAPGKELSRAPARARVAALLLLIVLLATVALASRPLGSVRFSLAPAAGFSTAVASAGVFVLAAATLLTAGILAFAFWPRRRRKRRRDDEPEWVYVQPPVHWAVKLLAALLPLALASGFIFLLWRSHGQAPLLQVLAAPAPLPSRPATAAAAGSASFAGSAAFNAAWLAVALALGIVAGIVGLALLCLPPRHRDVLEDDEVAPGVEQAATLALTELGEEEDPRRAVIAAYARMERALQAAGLVRRKSEAPFEYLARILRGARVSGTAAHRLTDLFELARFSHHDVEPNMRTEAMQALQAMRQQLNDQARQHGHG